MAMPDAPNDQGTAAAEETVFRLLAAALERQEGGAEALLYLRHILSARVQGEKRDGGLRRVRLRLYQRTSDYSVQLSAVTGEQRGWHFHELGRESDDSVEPERALEAAKAAAAPPEGAELAHSGYEDQGGEPVFVARWRHVVNGIPVERDFIHVLVNGSTGKAFLVQRSWHAVDEKPRWQ
jgi:hypothetical protein